jgi:hypothetical protein
LAALVAVASAQYAAPTAYSGPAYNVQPAAYRPAPVAHKPTAYKPQYEVEGPAQYSFTYDVNAADTYDVKSQSESLKDGYTVGQYSLIDADGMRRTVEYTADDYNGFQATVKREPVNNYSPSNSVPQYSAPEYQAPSQIATQYSVPTQYGPAYNTAPKY